MTKDIDAQRLWNLSCMVWGLCGLLGCLAFFNERFEGGNAGRLIATLVMLGAFAFCSYEASTAVRPHMGARGARLVLGALLALLLVGLWELWVL
jgi:hypothetical protein